MKNKYACGLSVLLLMVNVLKAQQDWCGTARFAQRKAESSNEMANRFESFINSLQQDVATDGRGTDAINADVVYVPVVFHVVHNGDAVGTGENISEEKIFSQMDALNRDFNYLDPHIADVPEPFKELVADVKVQFCLAKFDPSGNPTTGIIRHEYAQQASWNTEDDIDGVLKPATTWDNKKYLNIWVVRMGGSLQSQGILAYATFPGFSSDDEDGVVARYNTIGTTGGGFISGYEEGKTVSHEVGHWLGLLHTWGFDDECGDQGDFIADTPDQADLNFGCPTFPNFSCSGQPNGDMYMNYMDYTYDACRNMFTLGQAERMHSTLSGARAGITQAATKCFYTTDAALIKIQLPVDTICSLTFNPLLTLKNDGLTPLTAIKLFFDIDGSSVQTYNWTGNLLPHEEVLVSLPLQTVSANANHILGVVIAGVNAQAADDFATNNEMTITFFAYDGGAGSAIPVAEGFETALLNGNWSLLNTNNDRTWERNIAVGGYGTSSSSAFINNRAYTTNPNKRRDAILTEAYDFSGIDKPELKFDIAYARRSASRFDTMNVYYSLDCGSNWIRVFNASGTDLATAEDDTALFVPDVNEWKTVSIPLLQASGQRKVSFKFENVTGWGNALYLDNVNIQNNPALSIGAVTNDEVKLFPNPANNMFAIRLPFNHSYHHIQIYNSIGELVYNAPLHGNDTVISTVDFIAGLYFVRVEGESNMYVEKLLVTK